MSLLLLIKTTSDKFYSNDTYAKVIGVDLLHINKLEREMLIEGLNFNVYVDEEEYLRFACLVSRVGCKSKSNDESISSNKPAEKSKLVAKQIKTISKSH